MVLGPNLAALHYAVASARASRLVSAAALHCSSFLRTHICYSYVLNCESVSQSL